MSRELVRWVKSRLFAAIFVAHLEEKVGLGGPNFGEGLHLPSCVVLHQTKSLQACLRLCSLDGKEVVLEIEMKGEIWEKNMRGEKEQ